jgi:hypothetical protein
MPVVNVLLSQPDGRRTYIEAMIDNLLARNHDWSWPGYLSSLFQRRMVYQVFALDDLVPMLKRIEYSFSACLQYVQRSLKNPG